MKRMKKILSVLLSVVMVMAMGITAFAEGGSAGATASTYSVTISNATGSYAIYQVFEGDLSVDSNTGAKTLSNVKWGKDVDEFEYTIKDADPTTSIAEQKGIDAKEIAKYLATKSNDIAVAKDFAKTAIKNVKENSNSGIATTVDGTATFNNLDAGYYVVKNTSVGASESYTEYILQVVGNVNVNNKAEVPTSQKKVKDINDSTDATETNWQDSADYDIGDEVPFQLKGTIADNYDAYTSYYYAFHDIESEGLTFKKITSVYVMNGSDKTELNSNDYTLKVNTTEGAITDGCSFELIFNNLKALTKNGGTALVDKNSQIFVEYTSTLNSKAVLGSQGNPNTMHLEFSNNPNGEEKGTTPNDTVIVFTYKVVINKVDEKGNALTGANFKLEKQAENGKWKEVDAERKSISDAADGTKKCVFTFTGLDDGVYRLTETQTPTGFNTIDQITFTVTAHHDISSNHPQLNKLSGEKKSGEITLTSNKNTGSLTSDVVNKEGSILPSTGGIGTTIFYVVGAVLMIGAGVILVSRRRANK